jgi:hypothetical protein
LLEIVGSPYSGLDCGAEDDDGGSLDEEDGLEVPGSLKSEGGAIIVSIDDDGAGSLKEDGALPKGDGGAGSFKDENDCGPDGGVGDSIVFIKSSSGICCPD